MTSVQLTQALIDLLKADRDGDDAAVAALVEHQDTATPDAWPDADTSVKLDPRIYFFDEVAKPAVRLCLDPDGCESTGITNGGINQIKEKVCVGFSMRVESEEQFAAFLEWGQYLANLLSSVPHVNEWTSTDLEWAYTHEPQLFSTGQQSETIVGQMIGLFLIEWSTTR